ncbi:hypothetical protein HPB51_026582 [Rhipicephalus microplus]|uniref:Uncharacterized protein n=1 Tax=Rhipicephalus microplus TaxID=6941 RepID=A0A9J6D2P6_RHIMP|nr:hypothetical protein HPB51_026582 [Rhipicephalus microplus]
MIRNTVHRNLGYVARAAQFLNQARSDILSAAALDRVYRHPALIAELSKVLAVSEADAVVAVRQGYRSIQGMHEFMRLAGVVRRASRVSHVTMAARSWTPRRAVLGSRAAILAAGRRRVALPLVDESVVAEFYRHRQRPPLESPFLALLRCQMFARIK